MGNCLHDSLRHICCLPAFDVDYCCGECKLITTSLLRLKLKCSPLQTATLRPQVTNISSVMCTCELPTRWNAGALYTTFMSRNQSFIAFIFLAFMHLSSASVADLYPCLPWFVIHMTFPSSIPLPLLEKMPMMPKPE